MKVFVAVTFFVFTSFAVNNADSEPWNKETESLTYSTGCTSKFLLPNRPFLVVWNHPSGGCEKAGIDLNLSAWDIVENKGDEFAGEMMRIYYNIGEWPILRRNGSVLSNGGVPQRGDVNLHLSLVKKQVEKDVQEDFDGVAVFDMEAWRPRYEHNFDALHMYQDVSIAIAKARYPKLNHTELVKEAAKEFDAGAENFLGGTLDVTSTLRPGGHWGFYGFPRNWAGGQSANDQLAYMWTKSRGLFPRIYMQDRSFYNTTKTWMEGEVNETLRIYAKFSSPDTLILPYSLCNDNGTNYFSKENLTLSIGLPGQMGAAGVVIWGSSGDYRTKNECRILQDYIRTTLGPYVKTLTEFFTSCSQELCSGHGRCMEKQYASHVQMHRKANGRDICTIHDELLQKNNGKKNVASEPQMTNWIQELHGLRFGDELPSKNERLSAWNAKRNGVEGRNRFVEYFQREGVTVGRGENGRVVDEVSGPYDNYVCRCLKGWSGDHCQNPA